MSDADLLTRFLDRHDEAAFEDLVARRLPAVRAVCRSLLRDPNDADDAVQATFLVLVRRAAAVRNRQALGGWLGRVAWRTANRLRTANTRRSQKDAAVEPDATPGPSAVLSEYPEIVAALNEEIERLPERYRLAVLACYAAGTPTAEAARNLGWPKGTLLTRLAWARKRLRDRLTRRSLALTGGFTAVFTGHTGRVGAVLLAGRITRAAVAVAAGDPLAKELVSERVFSLTDGVVRTMIGTKLKIAAGVGFLAVALLGLGLGRLTVGTAEANPAGDKKGVPLAGKPAGKPAAVDEAAPPPAPLEVASDPLKRSMPGNELVVRRPLGSFTREVAPYGRGTITFTENRIHVVAAVRIDKAAFTVMIDGDYTMNRESMVYGIITSADVTGPFDEEEALEVGLMASAATDMPFAFRVRVDDESVTIKDIKFGPFGSPAFNEAFGGQGEGMEVIMLITGKYKADPNPDRQPPLPAPRGNNPPPVPKGKPRGRSPGAAVGGTVSSLVNPPKYDSQALSAP
jgi:RNA polymerase sigma factor (sigma-70 family)